MTNENKPEKSTPESEVETTEISTGETPKTEGELVLGKRVLRHFGVRTDVQAGSASYTIGKRTR